VALDFVNKEKEYSGICFITASARYHKTHFSELKKEGFL
jgi:hypothetical protein